MASLTGRRSPSGAARGPCGRLLILITVVAALAAGEANTTGLACIVRPPALTGALLVDARGITAGTQTTPWGEIVAAGFAGRVARHLDQGLITVGGEVLRGLPVALDRGTVQIASGLYGQLRLPVERVAAIILAPQALDTLTALATGQPGAVLANGDRFAGRATFLDQAGVGIDTGRRVARVARERIAVLLLSPLQPATTRTRLWLLLGSGDRLAVDAIKPDAGGLILESPLGALTLPASAIAAAWSCGGRVTSLGALPGAHLVAVDRVGGSLPVAWGRGFPLSAGGVVAADGLLLPAFGEASWPVAGNAAFQCWVAPAPAAAGCTVRVLVDGAVAWERTLAAGAAATPVSVTLAGARTLALRCEPAAGGETADQAAVFAHAVVMR